MKIKAISFLLLHLFVQSMQASQEVKVAQEQPKVVGCFDIIKNIISTNKYRIADWDTCPLESKEMSEKTDCNKAAENIIELFTGKPDVWNDLERLIQDIQRQRKDFKDLLRLKDTYLGQFENFFKKEQGDYISAVAQRLFTESRQPEHTLFYVVLYYDAHGFVIEKVCDGNKTFWRIYTSWFGYFTLAQWLDIDEWKPKEVPFDLNEIYFDYGDGRKLNKEQIIKAIYEMFNIVARAPELQQRLEESFKSPEFRKNIQLFIEVFPVDPSTCKTLEKTLKQESEKAKAFATHSVQTGHPRGAKE
jgi:hypothetical protein